MSNYTNDSYRELLAEREQLVDEYIDINPKPTTYYKKIETLDRLIKKAKNSKPKSFERGKKRDYSNI